MIHYGAVTLVALMVLLAPLQMLLTLGGAPGGLFLLSALVTLGLTPPVLMLTATSPSVRVENDGFWIEPVIWKSRFIQWHQVEAAKVYPLLPSQNQEVQRRAFVGRRNYKPAEGIMLLIKDLPPQYAIAAFFAGESGKTIIALTNRTHTDYTRLRQQIVRHIGDIQPHA